MVQYCPFHMLIHLIPTVPRSILCTCQRDPEGQKRPADVIGNAVHVMRIATGQIEEKPEPKSAAAELGSKGGKARAAALSKSKRKAIARKAAVGRWGRGPRGAARQEHAPSHLEAFGFGIVRCQQDGFGVSGVGVGLMISSRCRRSEISALRHRSIISTSRDVSATTR